MPSQDLSQNQNNNSSVVPPVFSTPTDTPPIPPDFQNLPNDTGSASPPPPDFSSVVSAPKKKFGTAKIIASILGLVVLIGGVGAGILLTQQKQLVNQKAAGECGDVCTTIGETKCFDATGTISSRVSTCSAPLAGCTNNWWKIDHYVGSCNTPPTGQPGNCGAQNCDSTQECCTAGCFTKGSNCGKNNGTNCINTGSETIDGCVGHPPGWQYCSGGYARECYLTNICGSNPCPGPGNCDNKRISDTCDKCLYNPHNTPPIPPECTNPTTPPTAPPTVPPTAPYCVAIKAYNATWTEPLTSAQLSALTAGTTVNFCVAGAAPSGTFDKAQFKINTTLEPETTIVRPTSTDFCQSYTILPTDTTISVRAKIHHATLGWVGESI